MAYPKKGILKDVYVRAGTTSLATTPVPVVAVAPISGTIVKVVAGAGGTTTGTTNITVIVNAGADITGGALNIAAGTGARNGAVVDLNKTNAGAVTVVEGDVITFTPSGGTGASVPGGFVAVIRP